MADILGLLGLAATDFQFVNTIGQRIVYDATLQLLGDHNNDVEAMKSVFVARQTTDFLIRYASPGTGRMQRVGPQGRAKAVQADGGWDVGFPLEEFAARIDTNRVAMAYMSMQAYDRQLKTIMKQDVNTVRDEVLKCYFNNTARPGTDDTRRVTVTVQPLALTSDSVKYPPIVGSTDDATAQGYLTSGYVSSAISDANNPFPTMVKYLESHFGQPTGGSNIVVFINIAEKTVVEALADFDRVANRFLTYGDNVTLVDPEKYPAGLPGRTLGECSNALIQQWDWIPAGYMLAVHLDAEQAIYERIDPPELGLGSGLQLIFQDQDHPFRTAQWSHRFGMGIANRLNGVVMQLTAGSYAIPTIYT